MDDSTPVNPVMEEAAEFRSLPLYAWVVIAVLLAIPAGMLLGADASWFDRMPVAVQVVLQGIATGLDLAPPLIIRALGALAAPWSFWRFSGAIVTNDIRGRQGARMMGFYLLNTLVAMVIGLAVSNLIRPGEGADLGQNAVQGVEDTRLIDRLIDRPPPKAMEKSGTVSQIIVEMVPRSIGDAFATNNLAQLVLITVAVGVALAQLRNRATSSRSDHLSSDGGRADGWLRAADEGFALGGGPGPDRGLRCGVDQPGSGRSRALSPAGMVYCGGPDRLRIPDWLVPVSAWGARPIQPGSLPEGDRQRDGDDLQHREHGGDDPDHPHRPDRPTRDLPGIEPAGGLCRDELQQRRDGARIRRSPRSSLRRRLGPTCPTARLFVVLMTTLLASIGGGWHSLRQLRDDAPHPRGRASARPRRSRCC